ncbi:hypothetical protein BGX26_009932 [Mortierella sp. AD094]|nr:hypothetical protein BGX26_009932 [Mortierella sp. AD094]
MKSGSYYSVPEISIAPPTTISSGDDSRASSRAQSQSQTSMSDVNFSAHIQREGSMDSHTLSCPQDRERKPRAGMASPPLVRPPDTTESIFPELTPTTPSSSSSRRYAREISVAEDVGEDDYFDAMYESQIDGFLATKDLEIVVNDTQISTNPSNPVARPRMKRRHANIPASLIIPTPASTIAPSRRHDHISDTVKKDISKQLLINPSVENIVKIKDLDVDDSFDEEYHHQYPVVSAYQPAQGLFNILPSPTSASVQEATAARQQPTSVGDVNWGGYEAVCDDNDGNGDGDEEYRAISNLVNPLNISAATQPQGAEEQSGGSSFNDKDQAVARWAQE